MKRLPNVSNQSLIFGTSATLKHLHHNRANATDNIQEDLKFQLNEDSNLNSMVFFC